MSCCTVPYDLGCQDACSTFPLPFEYTQTGTYTFAFETQFRWSISQAGVEGQTMELDLTKFPENYELEIKTYNPDNTEFTFNIDDVQYDCFKLKINLT